MIARFPAALLCGLLLLLTACVPSGVPGGGRAAHELGPVTLGPPGVLHLAPAQFEVMPLNDAPAPAGVLPADGVVTVCPGAMVSGRADVLTGSAVLTVEVGAAGGPWHPIAEADAPALPAHVLPDGVDSVRMLITAGPDGATVANPNHGPRRSWLTVHRSCAVDASPNPEPDPLQTEPAPGPLDRPPAFLHAAPDAGTLDAS